MKKLLALVLICTGCATAHSCTMVKNFFTKEEPVIEADAKQLAKDEAVTAEKDIKGDIKQIIDPLAPASTAPNTNAKQ